jgi:hypothetical protein
MHSILTLARRSSLAAVFGAALAASGCGGPAAGHTAGASRGDWAHHANAICRAALPDSTHELVRHLDAAHIERHGRSIVAAGSKLDALGAPPDADAKTYAHMIALYKRSVVDHGLAMQEIRKGNDGVAAEAYSIGLALADRADAIAARLGAGDCRRFGMTA